MNAVSKPANNTRIVGILSIATALLLTPLIASQFTNEVRWTVFDYLVAGALLYGTSLAAEFVMRRVTNKGKRLLFAGIMLLALFLIWAELAVGLFGTPFAGS